MTDISLLQELKVNNTLGEGVIWDHRNEQIWWVDVRECRLYSWSMVGELQTYSTPEPLCSFALSPDPNWFIAAFASGFAYYCPASGETKSIVKIDAQNPLTRLNDGRTDRQGRFWSGSMVEGFPIMSPDAAFYRLDGLEQAYRAIEQIQISNGLCWSPDGQTMYFADSPTQQIKQGNYDSKSGQISNIRGFAHMSEGSYPDGACIDAEGCLWSAQWGGSQVTRFSPQGQLLLRLELPCPNITCVAFGGPHLRHLFITTAREGLNEQQLSRHPQSGNLFVFSTPFNGLPETVCNLAI